MKSTQTGIAVALAVVAIGIFFVFPGLSPFSISGDTSQPAATDMGSAVVGQNQTTPTIMPTENNGQLQIQDEVVGTGAVAAAGDRVTVNYVGSFTDGTVFDASANHGSTGFPFVLGTEAVIKGWDQGIVGMKVGGKRKLVVPPELGYGSQDYGPIPGNSALVFTVELLRVEKEVAR